MNSKGKNQNAKLQLKIKNCLLFKLLNFDF